MIECIYCKAHIEVMPEESAGRKLLAHYIICTELAKVKGMHDAQRKAE